MLTKTGLVLVNFGENRGEGKRHASQTIYGAPTTSQALCYLIFTTALWHQKEILLILSPSFYRWLHRDTERPWPDIQLVCNSSKIIQLYLTPASSLSAVSGYQLWWESGDNECQWLLDMYVSEGKRISYTRSLTMVGFFTFIFLRWGVCTWF